MPFLLYLFPVDAIQNNYNELGSLTEQKFILSQFWKPESEIKGLEGCVPAKAPDEDIFLFRSSLGGFQLPASLSL